MAQTIEAIAKYGPFAVREYTESSADRSAGEVLLGEDGRAEICVVDIDYSVQPESSVYTAGVFRVKKGSIAFSRGEPVYWDVTGNTALDPDSTVEAGDFLMGSVVADAASGDDFVLTDLNTHPQTLTGGSS